jgi:ATP-dependent DNA helicase RecQ
MENKLRSILKQYWGYDRFLPLQQEAMTSVLCERDSVVILPTGGGKSLCFQAPAMAMDGMAVVISPLISLMMDQVSALDGYGIPAAFLNSSLSPEQRREVTLGIRNGRYKLLYVAPERLVSEGFIEFIRHTKISFIAVDEAHCISSWGHDFRPEYRSLNILKESFPNIRIHAYTATATQQVREDIAKQLGLTEPEFLVGSFDRPNLIYSVKYRNNLFNQIREIVDRHKSESGVIYCIRRKDVEELSAKLNAAGYKALPYHAGLNDDVRQKNQEAFIREKVDIIVATVAFGMGIDKSNVRYVIHGAMPKSLEHYQQESGRAGRDGLEAECVLIYSAGDYGVWQSILNNSEAESEIVDISMSKLSRMYNYCTGATCRHRSLLEYFGQKLEKTSCDACDACLGGLELIGDSLVTAQKIISNVLRLKESFGGEYNALVLTGSKEQRILDNGHDQLSTYGLLSDIKKPLIRNWIEQLIAQDCLQNTGEYKVLAATKKGWQVLRGEVTPRLYKPEEKKQKEKQAKVAADSWHGVHKGLFEVLRSLRHELAEMRHVPTFIIFGDAALRDMARRRPTSLDNFLLISGVGQQKCKDFGEIFTDRIREYCSAHSIDTDVAVDTNSDPDIIPIPQTVSQKRGSGGARGSKRTYPHTKRNRFS